jgi:hypothetical protein
MMEVSIVATPQRGIFQITGKFQERPWALPLAKADIVHETFLECCRFSHIRAEFQERAMKQKEAALQTATRSLFSA